MARAETRTFLSLDRFAQVLGIHPLHFNQVFVTDLAPTTTCGSVYLQYGWQEAEKVGRDEIAQAISQAEIEIGKQLGFDVFPSWNYGEHQQISRPYLPEMYTGSHGDIRGQWSSLFANKGHLIYGGRRLKSIIGLNRPITYSDPDADGYFDTATFTGVVPVTSTLTEEVCAYHPLHGGDDSWEIRPITVTIAGGVATVICRREQLVKENLWEQFQPRSIDGLNNANFLTTVDLYRVYNDPSVQVTFIWDTPQSGVAAATYNTQTGAMVIVDPRLGKIRTEPATWNAVTQVFDSVAFVEGRQPDRMYLYYRAGWLFGSFFRKMDPMWERVIARYALTFLERPLCACNQIKDIVSWWREDYSLAQSNQSGGFRWNKPIKLFNCPLGTTRGAIEAWRYIQQYKLGE